MLQDLRTALRVIARDRWLTAAAVTALALGIGVNAAVFTLVNAVLIRGLPFPDSHNLYMLGARNTTQPGGRFGVSHRELAEWRGQSQVFSDMAGFSNASLNIADDVTIPEQQRGVRTTPELFRTLRIQPALGRDFTAEDGVAGAPAVAILGDALWRSRYGADPSIVGRAIRINGEPTTVVGVMPPNMKFPTNAELWVAAQRPATSPAVPPREFGVVARVTDDVTRAAARADLETIAARLAAQYPESNANITPVVETANERFNGGEIRVLFLAMLGAVGFVLLIACANVANLQLSRSVSRAREIAVRVAMGATRWRIVRQLLVESVLIACIGGAFGLLIALAGVRLFDAAVAGVPGKPYWIQFTFDPFVFAYLAAICVATGIIFGVVPALQISRTNVNTVLKEGGRGNIGGRRAQWLSGTMVVVELALTIVLLAGAGLMVRSFLRLQGGDIGIPTEGLMTMRLSLPAAKYTTAESRMEFYDRLIPRLAGLPGAAAAGVTTTIPGSPPWTRRMEVEGRPVAARWQDLPRISTTTVSPGFFDATTLRIVRGRALGPDDGAPGAEAIVVNQRFAAEHFQGEDPIGRRVRFPAENPPEGQPDRPWLTIVGITADLAHIDMGGGSPDAVAYTPLRYEPPFGAVLLVRSALPPAAVMQAVRTEVQAVDPDQPVFTIQTLEQVRADASWGHRVFGSIFGLFALIALTLSAVGLYAVMAYSVTQRTPEIGVRMALGAGARQVSWLVLKRGLIQLGVGLTLGLAGALGASRVLSSLLVPGITPQDPMTFAAITLLLVGVAVSACLIPAGRAARVDPLVALRE
jgi:putative ABC transport system permease protein